MKRPIMLKSLVVALLACAGFAGNSQTLTVEGTAPNLYIPYTVVAKDNFYSVGRQFNQTPKAIAAFNSLVMDKGLRIGQKLKIPVTAQNLDATGSTGSPLTHIAASSETLTRIAANHNVSVQQLKQWNSLTSDNIAAGTPLVVGYLRTQGGAPATNTSVAVTPAPPVKTEMKAAPPVAIEPKKEEPHTTVSTPAPKDTLLIVKSDPPPATNHPTDAAIEEPVKEKTFEPIPKETPVRETPAKAETSQPQIKEVVVKQQPVRSEPSKTTSSRDTEQRRTIDISTGSIEGAFASVFSNEATRKSLSTISGDAATFKSTSGWQDKKYYVLINDVPAGSVLKISSGDKAVYAKVLGSMPEMKENTGLLLRLSNSAASYLGIVDSKFPVEVTYYK